MSSKNYIEDDRRAARAVLRKADENEATLKILSALSTIGALFEGIRALTNPDDLDQRSAYAVLGLVCLGTETEKTLVRQFEDYRKLLSNSIRSREGDINP